MDGRPFWEEYMLVYFAAPLFCQAEKAFNLQLTEKLENGDLQYSYRNKVELGIAYGQKHLLQQDKLLIGLQTDSRAAFLGTKLNAMIHGPLEYIVDNENDLIAALEKYRPVRTERRESF